MCLILLSYQQHPEYPLIFAANRDEFYDRPTAAASFWPDAPDVLAGKDLREGGTWMGITRKGRMAALTNYRDPAAVKLEAPSRGWLVRDFLTGNDDAAVFCHRLESQAHLYNGFNLMAGHWSDLRYISNVGGTVKLSAGVYGLSNHLLNTPWPKVKKAREAFGALLDREREPSEDALFDILADRSRPADASLPDTGVGLEWERILSSVFIVSPVYGTRSSTVMLIDRKGRVRFIERVFNSHPDPWMTARFEFRIGE